MPLKKIKNLSKKLVQMTIKWVPKWDLAKHGARYKTPKNGIENYSKFSNKYK